MFVYAVHIKTVDTRIFSPLLYPAASRPRFQLSAVIALEYGFLLLIECITQ